MKDELTIKFQVKINRADYERVMEFARRDPINAEWLNLEKKFCELVNLSWQTLNAQITAIETKVAIRDKKIIVPGSNQMRGEA